MALTQFTDAAGRTAWKDDSGNVFTEGGSRNTYYNVDQWNQRQAQKYGSGSSSSSKSSSSNKSSSTSKAPDYSKIVQESLRMMQEANKPAVQSLQASIPETAQKFEQTRTQLQGEVEPLKARYENLLSKIKNKETTATNRQTVTTQNELAKRGILSSSGVAQQELTNALNPITSEYATLSTDAELGREADLRALANQIAGLTTQETDATRAIQNAIAQLQAGGNQSAIQNALGQYNVLESSRQFDIGSALQQAQQALNERQFSEVTLPQAQYALNKPYYQPQESNPLLEQILAQITGRLTGNTTTTDNNANFSLSDGRAVNVRPPLSSYGS